MFNPQEVSEIRMADVEGLMEQLNLPVLMDLYLDIEEMAFRLTLLPDKSMAK
jgi:hypothetical protein